MAIYVDKPRPLTFIHIPKTAGVAISTLLKQHYSGYEGVKNHGGKHADLAKVKRYRKEPGFVFVVIRNPWDRLVSTYFYYTNRGKISSRDLSFEQFIKKEWSKGWACSNRPQHQYFNEREVDLVVRFEQMETDLIPMFDYLNVGRSKSKMCNFSHLPQKNTTKRQRDYRTYYTPEMVDIVSEKLAADIEMFGYKFE